MNTKRKIDLSNLNSIMEGFDISTQPATNAGAPFTGGTPPTDIQGGLYKEMTNADRGDFAELELPVEIAEECIELTKTQEAHLNSVLREFSSTEEEENFSKMVSSLLKV